MKNITMGTIIKEKRKALGLTQKGLADKLGVSDKAVSKWERNDSLPDVSLIPQIALALNVSIDCLFGSTEHCTSALQENSDCDAKKHQHALSSSAAMLQHKVKMRYLAAALAVIGIMLFFFFGTLGFVAYQFRPLFFCFLAVSVYALVAVSTQKYRILQNETGLPLTNGSMDKIFAATTLSSVYFILVFGYFPVYIQHSVYSDLSTIIANLLGAAETDYSISALYPYSTAPFVLLFTAIAVSMLVSEKKTTFTPTVYITTASFALSTVIHILYYSIYGAVIIKNKAYMYGFWLDNPTVTAVMDKLNIYTVIYAVITFAVAAVFTVFIKEKRSKAVYAVCALPMWLYQTISAFGFINRDFDGMSRNFAQLKMSSIVLSLTLVASVPHIVMILNGLTHRKNKPV